MQSTPRLLLAACAAALLLPLSVCSAAHADTRGRAYLHIGVDAAQGASTRFGDAGGYATAAPLYGSARTFTSGDFDTAFGARIGAGYRIAPRLQAGIEMAHLAGLGFSGNANYARSGDSQPSRASVDSRQMLVRVAYEMPLRRIGAGNWTLYAGAGAGVAEHRTTDFAQRFPALNGGAGGEVASTLLPDGRSSEALHMAQAGLVVPLGGRLALDVSYRYQDAGRVRTNSGNIAVQRYRADGSARSPRLIGIQSTAADLQLHLLSVALRIGAR